MARRQPTLSKLVCEALPVGARVLVAVSGGKDSVVLLDVLLSIVRIRKLVLEVAHVDHSLRDESPQDAEFVKQLAYAHSLPFHLTTLSPPHASVNLESWGRTERYSFFERVLTEKGLDWIVTAHTANDVAETLLMRLFANKGVGNILQRDERRRVLRPILRAYRSQIDEYAASHALAWREDSTNKETVFTRNKVRHEILPVLANTFGESVVRTLSERGMALSQDEHYLSLLANEAIAPLIPLTEDSAEWLERASELIDRLPHPLRWRAAEIILLKAVGYPVGPRRGALIADALILGRGRVDLGEDLQVIATSKGVRLSKVMAETSEKRGDLNDLDPSDEQK